MAVIFKYVILAILVADWTKNSLSQNNNNNKTILSRLRRQITSPSGNASTSCVTPSQPANGQWFYLNYDAPPISLEYVLENTTIGYKCNKGYLLSSNIEDIEYAVCQRDEIWGKFNLTRFPVCNRLCPAFYNTSVTTVYCKSNETDLAVPCDKAIDDTLLTYECAEYYEPSFSQSVLRCFDGSWNHSILPLCVPECGNRAAANIDPLIIGGEESKKGKYPWVVAVYSNIEKYPNFTNICGGTILTPNIVLTAAHCVSELTDGKLFEAKYYRVSAGKFFNPYKDLRDSNTTQNSEVQQILMHPEYKGDLQQNRFDIALLKLLKIFILSDYVQPACFRDFKNYLPEKDTDGWVSGWGYTSSAGDPSDVLKEIYMPIRERNKCYQDFDEDWADMYFTYEKICAGYFNQSTSVCRGDSGGGLVVQHPKNKKFYVYGIVSIGHAYVDNSLKHCNIQKTALFTKVASYYEWMQKSVDQLSCDRCQNSTQGLSTDGCDFCQCLEKFCPMSSRLSESTPEEEDCGRKLHNSTVVLVGGEKVESVLPWAMLIFRKTDGYKCGGTLISSNLIITAAGDISSDIGEPFPVESYYAEPAGEFYRQYVDIRYLGYEGTQKLDIEKIVIHPNFRGRFGWHRDNLAIIKVKGGYKLNLYVQPICYEGLNFSPKDGFIASRTIWGYIPYSPYRRTKVPVTENLPIINYYTCYNLSEGETWTISQLTSDKLCTGYLNGTKNEAECVQYQGHGLVVQHPVSGRYFLYGVASLSEVSYENHTLKCSSRRVFTDTTRYLGWIQEQIASFSRKL